MGVNDGGSLYDGGGPAGVVEGFDAKERRLSGVDGGSEEPGARNMTNLKPLS